MRRTTTITHPANYWRFLKSVLCHSCHDISAAISLSEPRQRRHAVSPRRKPWGSAPRNLQSPGRGDRRVRATEPCAVNGWDAYRSAILLGIWFLVLTSNQTLAQFVQIQGGGTYSSIQSAINASSNGQTIIVYPATYNERINFSGKNIAVRSLNPTDPETIDDTVINGQALGSVVTFNSGESAASILEGFTILNGAAANGAGITCSNASSPTIRNNAIRTNIATVNGGGVFVSGSSNPTIIDNRISDNRSTGRGAGIYIENSSPLIRGNVIQSNISQGSSGGGLHLGVGSSGATITSNTIYLNTALFGGGLHVENASPTINGNKILGNFGTPRGAGLSCTAGSPLVTNNIIAGNQSNLAAAMDLNNASPSIHYNTIISNRAAQSAIVLAANNSHPIFHGNILAFHDNGFALHVVSASSIDADYNCFYQNVGGNSTGNVQLGAHNLQADPQLATIGTWVEGQLPVGGNGGDIDLVATLQGTAPANGIAEYKLKPDRERFQVEVFNMPPNQTLPVTLNGMVVGQLHTGSQGSDEIDYDTDDGNFPAWFPEVQTCDEVAVGGLLVGSFQIEGAGINCDALIWQPGDEHLTPTSPCRDNAMPLNQGNLATTLDMDNQLRPFALISDIGADEYTTPGTGDFDGDMDVDLSDFREFQTCFTVTGVACIAGDFDSNASIQHSDFQQFANSLSGPS